MPTFQISDPTAAVTLSPSVEGGKPVSKGKVVFSVANSRAVPRTATLSVRPGAADDAPFYAIVGATPADPASVTLDFAAREAQNVTVTILAPHAATARPCAFKLHVTQETDPDNDVAESRPVAFTLPAAPPVTPPAPKPFPWLALAIAGVVVLAVVGFGLYKIVGTKPSPPPAPPTFLLPNLIGSPAQVLVSTFAQLGDKTSANVRVVPFPSLDCTLPNVTVQIPNNSDGRYPVGTRFTFVVNATLTCMQYQLIRDTLASIPNIKLQ